MADRLLSVGLDVGTTTSQMIVSQITVENQASSFAVPKMDITERKILYKSPVRFTPLKAEALVDGDALRAWVESQYAQAGICRQQVATGAVIITGETSRKENAAAVLQALSELAGEFVVATAGPDLESVLAAKGGGAVAYSERTGTSVLHMDIGGGTSNLAWIENGQIRRTGCLNVGGRLVKLDADGRVTYISPVLSGLCSFRVGEKPSQAALEALGKMLCSALEMAAGKKEKTPLLDALMTREVSTPWEVPTEPLTVSFSGGVADCIEKQQGSFGDIGPVLGRAIKESSLCSGAYRLGTETIRATVIGAGCHSTQLSGSTVFCRNVTLPKKNLPVLKFTRQEQECAELPRRIREKLAACDSVEAVLAMPGYENPNYEKITELAEKIACGVGENPAFACVQGDMAKALGQRISRLLPEDRPCLCLDGLDFLPESYLDIGTPVGPCFPVIIKTLVLS